MTIAQLECVTILIPTERRSLTFFHFQVLSSSSAMFHCDVSASRSVFFLPGLFFVLFLLLAPCVPAAFPPVVCSSRAGAVALVAAACQLRVHCRYEFGANTAALPLAGWDLVLVNQTGLLSPTVGLVTASDTRRRDWAASTLTAPLLVHAETDASALDCEMLAITLAATRDATLVPDTLWVVIDTLVAFQHYSMDANQCADLNEIPVWDRSTAEPTLQWLCAMGKTCHVESSGRDEAVLVIAILVLAGAVLFIIYGIVSGRCNVSHKSRHAEMRQ